MRMKAGQSLPTCLRRSLCAIKGIFSSKRTPARVFVGRRSKLWFLMGVIAVLASVVSSCSSSSLTSTTNERASVQSPAGHRVPPASSIGGLSKVPTLPLSEFPKPVAQALVYLADEHPSVAMPILAPSFLPESSTTKGHEHLSVIAHGSPVGYSVVFYQCRQRLPMNSPRIGVGQCSSVDSVVGAFGGQLAPSAAIAERDLPEVSSADSASSPASCPSGFREHSQSIPLRPGLKGTLLTCLAQLPTDSSSRGTDSSSRELSVSWQMSGWHLVVLLGGEITWQSITGPILSVLSHHPLPATAGSMEVDASVVSEDGLHKGE